MAEDEKGYAEAWRPDPGDKIKGRVLAVTMGPDMGYGQYPIVTLDVDGQERAVHAFHTVLRTELARRRPRPGDDLEITYQGKRSPKSGNGNDFHVYRVIGGQEPEFNWDSQLPPDERGLVGVSVPAASSARATAEPPIPPADYSPLPPQPTMQEQAAENFGEAPPF